MSKAFTREDDDAPEPRPRARPTTAFPPGTKNYLTPAGARRLQEELDGLIHRRPQVIAAPEGSDARRALPALDQRIQLLRQSLHTAVIASPPAPPWEQVRFGATVIVRDTQGAEARYRIVGVDETDLDRDWVSWLSPIAKVLLNARLGERVRFQSPAGSEQLEIVGILYE